MTGWVNRTDSAGNPRASFRDTIDGILVEAYLQDCDGEGVDWTVMHDGVVYASGEVLVNGIDMSAETDAWEEAKAKVQAYICAIPGYPMIFAFSPKMWAKIVIEQDMKNRLKDCDKVLSNLIIRNTIKNVLNNY